jgi:hypothetical protein
LVKWDLFGSSNGPCEEWIGQDAVDEEGWEVP